MSYLTLEGSIRANGDRHMANAARHDAEGNPDYAAGSRAKAERNYVRADGLRFKLDLPPFIADYFERMTRWMADDITRNLYS